MKLQLLPQQPVSTLCNTDFILCGNMGGFSILDSENYKKWYQKCSIPNHIH